MGGGKAQQIYQNITVLIINFTNLRYKDLEYKIFFTYSTVGMYVCVYV